MLTDKDNSIFGHITLNHPADNSNKWRRFQKVNDAKGRKAMDNALQHMHATLERENKQA